MASTSLPSRPQDNARPAERSQPKEPLLSMSVLLFLGLVLFVGWAAWFEIDQSVRAQGQVIPSARTQIIQSADGGVLAELLVREGEAVSAGQKLAVLEKERVEATFEESRSRVAALEAALVRAQAESQSAEPSYSEEFAAANPELVFAERTLFEQKKRLLDSQIATFDASLSMARQELDMNENLMATGDASQLEVMRARRQVSDIEGERSDAVNKYLRDAFQEVSDLEAELGVARQQLEERRDVLEHADLYAPVDGIVKFLKFTTVGAVLRPGDELMQISPAVGGLVLEIKVRPADIGQLKLGLPSAIKLDAFDFTVYGGLNGELSYISSDTLTEKNGDDTQTYYRAQVTLDEAAQKENPKLAGVALRPGMGAMVDIKTNRRTVLSYITKPVTRAFSGALQEL